MSSPLLALFIRSLREDTRARATYWMRGGLSCFLGLMLLFFAIPGGLISAPGRVYFSIIISIQTVGITFVGLSYFGSAVAEEKEEHTLGLLRMTGLDPLSILLGKSTSRLCGALMLLIAQFPFTIFAVTLGGVSLWQIAAVYCTLATYTFLLCNFALLGSVLARTTGGAVTFCVVVTGLFTAIAWALATAQTVANRFGVHPPFESVTSDMWTATPIARLMEILGTGFSGPLLGWQVASNLTLGVICFLLAWAAFERFCERVSEEAAPATVTLSPSVPPPAGQASPTLAPRQPQSSLFWPFRSRPPRVWKDALRWKDFYFLCGGRRHFTLRVIGYGGAFIYDLCAMISGSGGSYFSVNGSAHSLIPFIFTIDAAVMASGIFRTELRDQTLSTLSMLPCDMRFIVGHKVRACLLAAAPGALCAFVIEIIYLVHFGNLPGNSLAVVVLQTLDGWLLTLLILFVVAWLSLYMKRGALPVGFVGTYMVSAIASVFLMTAAATGAFVTIATMTNLGPGAIGTLITYAQPILTSMVSLLAIWFFYRDGLRRLEFLAGES